jgi:cyclopropane fatty-acyl-phospholipid synthase-like methyltransferase
MRVLDIGCGVGDLSLLAAELVGSSGKVLGIDRSAEAIAIAARRAKAAGCSCARFGTAEMDVGTLAARLRQEAITQHASILFPPLIGAWTRLLA